MIIPSIDIMGGRTVQLVGGKELKVDAGDPRPIAERFGLVGEIAVIDLDAARGVGSNRGLIRDILGVARCRVGGGIRDAKTAIEWLDAGAEKVILGTGARPEILRELPRERAIAALDALRGDVVVEGWQKPTGRSVEDRMAELREYVGGFLVTLVESEGRMQGIDLARVQQVVRAAAPVRVTAAGGVTTGADVAAIDRLGADCQVGMALYTGRLSLADSVASILATDRPDGLWPTVVVDEHGVALGLAYSSLESLERAIEARRGVYHSRTRGVWIKGETSGQTQELLRIDVDCDRDALRFTVRQAGGGFCHAGTWTCWGVAGGLPELSRRIASRVACAPEGSYTKRLASDPGLLRAKLVEEARELADAHTPSEVANEAADVVYFALTRAASAGVPLERIEAVLDRRALKVTRRAGNAKAAATDASRAPPGPAAGEAPRLRRVLPGDVGGTRRQAVDPETVSRARDIVEDVRARGASAVREWGERLGDLRAGDPLVLDRPALRRALEAMPREDRALLERAAARILEFAGLQRRALGEVDAPVPGGRAGHWIAPVERAGCYAPGGRFPLPSSALMTAVTARAAGVGFVCVASPRPSPATLAAAAIAGADCVLAVGGAHAIGALAYGIDGLPGCDIVVGPGNRWVTAAKQVVSGTVGIDMLAGPSELVVLADDSAVGALVAADLLAQAEHDTDALPVLVTTSAGLAEAVDRELAFQVGSLPTRATAEAALANGYAVVCGTMDEATMVCDRIAPEHLQVLTRDAEAVSRRLRHYGAIFIGPGSAEVFGDYGAGPNHTLPTGGTARFAGGLSVLNFLRVRTWLRMDSAEIGRDAAALARIEGLEAHARAAEARA